MAIAAYNLSLEVRTPTAFPIDCLQTGRNLGDTANLIEDLETAIKGYNLAIEAVENIRLEALNPQRQQEILSEAMDVYHGIVQSYLNLNQKDRALEYVERSKTRYLVQLLTERDIYPFFPLHPTPNRYFACNSQIRMQGDQKGDRLPFATAPKDI